ncbi:hypothetical protein ACVSMB_23350, partial [Pseudomonas aeruginosa]
NRRKHLMTEWILALVLAGSTEPVVTAKGYKTVEQCETAGDLMKAADESIRKSGKAYSITCSETPSKS